MPGINYSIYREKFIISITGMSCSGKTTLSNLIYSKYPSFTSIVHQDSYYNDLNDLNLSDRKKINFDHPSSIDFKLLYSDVKKLLSNKSIKIPKYNFYEHRREKTFIKLESKPIIILEGTLINSFYFINRLVNHKIFFDIDQKICLNRRIHRDKFKRGRKFSSIVFQFQKDVIPMYNKYTLPQKDKSDIIINSSNFDEKLRLILNEIKKFIK